MASALRTAGLLGKRLRTPVSSSSSSSSVFSVSGTAPARSITHFYGNLEANLRNSAGAKGHRPAELPFVDQIRSQHLLNLRFHVGHHKRKLDRQVAGQIYGFRHNVAIFDIAKSWRSLRTIFYAFAEMAHMRSSFFLLAPNASLPMQKLIERMRREYPFKYNKFASLYMLGYADRKYIDGTFSNWKQTAAFYEHVQRVLRSRPNLQKFRRLQKYLRGVDSVDVMGRIVPDFMLVFATDRGAMHEAGNLDIPMVGMVDSNTSPLPFLYPVFGNDDSVQGITFMMDLLGRAVEEGRKREHEAFAMAMVTRLKERLAEGVAVQGAAVTPGYEEGGNLPNAVEEALAGLDGDKNAAKRAKAAREARQELVKLRKYGGGMRAAMRREDDDRRQPVGTLYATGSE